MNEINLKTTKQPVALVTGASGFIGSHLTRQLVRDGWQVHIVSRTGSCLPYSPEFEYITNHVHDGSTGGLIACVAQAKPDVVFHLASFFLSQHEAKDIELLIRSNVLFGTQLLEAMKVNGVKIFINTGTSWQHYNNEDYNPVCLYAATKQAFEAILEYYIQVCGIKIITLKLFDTYGQDDPRPKLFYLLENAASNHESLNMSLGDQVIDLVHIDDVVRAYLIAAKRLQEEVVLSHESYAVSSGKPISLKELVQLYVKLSGQKIKINWGARPYRFREVMNTWNRGAKLAKWEPRISLEDGLAHYKDS